MKTTDELTSEFVKARLAYCLDAVKRDPAGKLRYAYLVPGGPYSEQWDWDAFFMAVGLAAHDSSQACYLKNWVLNFLDNAAPDGKVAGCLTPEGWDPRLRHMKPFLAQGAYLASTFLEDHSWIEPVWSSLCRVATYRLRHLWFEEYGLGAWFDAMESGADNNVSSLEYPQGTVLAADLNTFLALELKALGRLAQRLGKDDEAEEFLGRSTNIVEAMNRYLWHPDEQIYFNLFTVSGKHVPRVSYSSFVPLWAGLAPQEDGRSSLARYLLSEEHMASPFGFRTLSKSDPVYNNVNMIKPYSNWQGPVWPIANYLYMHALLRYGFRDEARTNARTISRLVLDDIDKTNGMHENYDAETGHPLAAPHFISWNLLVRNMLEEAESERNPFAIE